MAHFAYISRREGKFQLYALDLVSGQEQRLSDTSKDESQAFRQMAATSCTQPNLDVVATLAVVSVDGKVKQKLTVQAGDIREPTWGPFMK
jgi:TolB protein